jgi:Fe-S cluster biogenesis protein NfuA
MPSATVQHPLAQRVEAALDSIREYLRADGGDVRLAGITPQLTVQLELLGACTTCSMSPMTMRAGIEQAIRRAVPEVAEVVTVDAGPTV